MKLVKCKKPKNYISTNIYFSSIKSADEYVTSLDNEFLLTKAKALEYPLSKRKIKLLKFAMPKKHLLTKHGNNKFLLWEEC